MITRRFWILLIMIFLFTVSGCHRFAINENLNGAKVIYDKDKYAFFIQKQDSKEKLQIQYNQKNCAI